MSEKPATVDFGAPVSFGAHLFRIEIPGSRNEPVIIIEDYGYRGLEGGIPREEERVVLARVLSGRGSRIRRVASSMTASKLPRSPPVDGTPASTSWIGCSARSYV